jgi:glycine/D-amino acid oxidase-like deaminating enzyme
VAAALRHELRWRAVGLGCPPDLQLFEAPVRYRWPQQRAEAYPQAVLVFGEQQLAGIALHAGWSNDRDRTRVAEVVLLDADADAKAVTQAALAAIVAGGAMAVRVLADGCAARHLSGTRPTLDAGGVTWVHVAKGPDLVVELAERPVSDAELHVVGAFGPGGWPVGRERLDPPVTPDIHDPSVAHTQLIKSSTKLRPWFYPGRAHEEETDILVVGAGIAGLTSAYALRPRECLVLERETRLGGTARAHDGPLGRMGVGAHYEHDPDTRFSPEILELYEKLDIAKPDAHGRWSFVDAEHYIDTHRNEQSVLPNGSVRMNTWQLFESEEQGQRTREAMLRYDGRLTMPSRLADAEMRVLEKTPFSQWLRDNGLELSGEFARGMDIVLRSDYGVGTDHVSAFAALHFFICRPYLTTGSRTWAPPEGLSYVVDRLLQRTANAAVRSGHMVRSITPERDSVRVDVIDLNERRSYIVRARAVVMAAPKKSLKYLHAADAPLFASNRYASWITVNCVHDFGPERELMCWTNHTHDKRPEHIGFTWVNHAQHDAPAVLGHYLAYEYASQALVASPRLLVRDSLSHTSALLGTDAASSLRSVRIEKFGHAMPKPLPGTLFIDANNRRVSERVVYAGVDTGRLPLLAEAFDSGLEAAKALSTVR